MDDDDFGELYSEQAVIGLSSGGAGSSHNPCSSYSIFDVEIEEHKASVSIPVVHTLPPPTLDSHATQLIKSPTLAAKLHEPDPLTGRDSDEDDDMLLLNVNSKSGFAGKKVPPDDRHIGNSEEEFTKLTDIAKVKNATENGSISSFSESNRAVWVSGIMPTSGCNPCGAHITAVTKHTITIPGLSTTLNAPFFDLGDTRDATQDAWEEQEAGTPHMRSEGGVAMVAADDWDTDSDGDLDILVNSYDASGEKGASGRYEAGSESEDDEDFIFIGDGERAEEGDDQLLQASFAQAIQGDGPGEKPIDAEGNKGPQDKALAGVHPPSQAPRGYGYHNYNSSYKVSGGRGGPLKLINGRGDWRVPGNGIFSPYSTSQFSSWSMPWSNEFSLPPSICCMQDSV